MRFCANGSKKISYLKEFYPVDSPTVSLEVLLSVLMIGYYEGCTFISFDAPGDFLQAEMADDKLVIVKIKG